MGFDKTFALNDDGTCPRCGGQGLFYVSKGGKTPGAPFEKCNACDVMSSSKRPAGYTPTAQPCYTQQPSYCAPAPPSLQSQPVTQYTNARNSNAWSSPPSGPIHQGATQPAGQFSSQSGAPDRDIQQLTQQIAQLTSAVNHLTNAIYEFSGSNNDLLKSTIQALDAMSSKITGLEDAYEKMQ